MIDAMDDFSGGHLNTDEGKDGVSADAAGYVLTAVEQDVAKGVSKENMIGLSALIYGDGGLIHSGALPAVGQIIRGSSQTPRATP